MNANDELDFDPMQINPRQRAHLEYVSAHPGLVPSGVLLGKGSRYADGTLVLNSRSLVALHRRGLIRSDERSNWRYVITLRGTRALEIRHVSQVKVEEVAR